MEEKCIFIYDNLLHKEPFTYINNMLVSSFIIYLSNGVCVINYIKLSLKVKVSDELEWTIFFY